MPQSCKVIVSARKAFYVKHARQLQPPKHVGGRRPLTPQQLRAGMPQSCKVIISARKAFCVKKNRQLQPPKQVGGRRPLTPQPLELECLNHAKWLSRGV